MNLRHYLKLDDAQLQRLADLNRRYRRLYDDPGNCEPMIIVFTPVPGLPAWEERLQDPLVMLKAELDELRPHLEIGDDRVPTVRVQFGTSQIAAAFGCAITIPKNSLPAAASHPLARAADVYNLTKPGLQAGWYGKLWEWTVRWLEQLPAGIQLQHPDIQSAFNSAHLIRGNDILTDFYDDPAAVERLLDLVTDYMLDVTRHAKEMISDDREWFFDYGALWKGFARISNCSMHMISPEFYRQYVLPRDLRFFQAIGGGRMHYCGTADQVIDEFFKAPLVTGLDYDFRLHDPWIMARRAPAKVTLMQTVDDAMLQRLLAGDWPAKRNLIVRVNAPSIAAGRDLLSRLRAAFHKSAAGR